MPREWIPGNKVIHRQKINALTLLLVLFLHCNCFVQYDIPLGTECVQSNYVSGYYVMYICCTSNKEIAGHLLLMCFLKCLQSLNNKIIYKLISDR